MTYTLHQGDALGVMSRLPDDSVDALITDPPYNSGGRTSKERVSRTARDKYTSGTVNTLADFPGDQKDQRAYTRWLAEILTEGYRVTRPQGLAVVFCDWRQGPATSDALQMAGWLWSGTLSWIKPACRPRKGGFRQSCEYMFWGVKGSLDSSRDLYLPGHFTGSQPRKGRVHITQKPVELMRDLVRVCVPGGTVLDPFTGSGSTGVAALLEGRQFVGIEVTPHYWQIADTRLAEVERDLASRPSDPPVQEDTTAATAPAST